MVLHSSHSRAARLLFLEASRQTLEQLLLTPMHRVELLLKMSAHPFVYGMLMALVGLPIYVFAIDMGGLTAWQVVTLYVFYAIVSFCAPSTSDVQLARFRNPDAEVSPTVLANASATRGARAGGWLGTVFGIVFGMQMLVFIFAALMQAGLSRFLPDALSPLWSGRMSFVGVYIWAYWLVIGLAAPMPCFGAQIPLIVFYGVIFALFRLRQFVNSSADLQTPRAYAAWLAPRERRLLLWGVVALGNVFMPPDPQRPSLSVALRSDIVTAAESYQPTTARFLLDVIVLLLFWLIPFMALVFSLPGFLQVTPPALLQVTTFCPWMAVLKLLVGVQRSLDPNGIALSHLPSLWLMSLCHIALGVSLLTWAAAAQHKAIRSTSRPVGTTRDTVRAGTESPTLPSAIAPRRVSPTSATERYVTALTRWLSERDDNPVFIKDLRAKGRQRDWVTHLVTGAVALLLLGCYALYEPAFATMFVWTAAPLANLNSTTIQTHGTLALISAPLWVLWWFGGAKAAQECAHSLESERMKSTMDFLLLTPLTDRDIVRGKLPGSLALVFLFAAQYAPVMILGLAFSAFRGLLPQALWLFLLGSAFVVSAVFMAAALTLAISTSPSRRRQTMRSGWDGVVFVLIEIFLMALLGKMGLDAASVTFVMIVVHVAVGAWMLKWCERFVFLLRRGTAE